MSYLPAKQLALKYGTSLKTIYNYLSKHKAQIQIKKEFGKKVVNENDFESVYSKHLQNYNHSSKETLQSLPGVAPINGREPDVNFQNQFNPISNGNVPVQNYNHSTNHPSENQSMAGFEIFEERLEKFQKQIESLADKNAELEKAKTTFEEKSQKYALRYKDEQSERKERQNKYTTLQDQHTQKIEDFGTVRIKLERRFYLLLGMAIFLALFLTGFILLYSSNRNLG